MPQNYIFEFNGTKEAFFNKLDSYPNNTSYNGDKFYHFNDFIVKVMDNKIHFGVARGGHSGGYWFVPTITENDKWITFCGTVKYIGPNDDRGKIRNTIDCIGESLLFILLSSQSIALTKEITILKESE